MEVKVSELKHHPKNKEIYDLSSIEDLMRSISDVGLLQPLVIDPLNQVISGNRRLESIKRLKWEKVNVVIKEVRKSEEEFLLSKLDHALYLGRELQKAEYCLIHEITYIQD